MGQWSPFQAYAAGEEFCFHMIKMVMEQFSTLNFITIPDFQVQWVCWCFMQWLIHVMTRGEDRLVGFGMHHQ